jgi:hypothetical protein
MNEIDIKFKIENLEELLKGRKEEYSVFGKTLADSQKDKQIRSEIDKLKKLLNK